LGQSPRTGPRSSICAASRIRDFLTPSGNDLHFFATLAEKVTDHAMSSSLYFFLVRVNALMPEEGVTRFRYVWKFGQVCIRHWLFKARLTPITTHQAPFTNQDSPAKSDNIHQFKPPEKTAQLPPSADFPLSRKKVLLARDL